MEKLKEMSILKRLREDLDEYVLIDLDQMVENSYDDDEPNHRLAGKVKGFIKCRRTVMEYLDRIINKLDTIYDANQGHIND